MATERQDSAWDRFDIAYTTINLAFLQPGETPEQARAKARTRAVRECFECLTDGTPFERRMLALRTLAEDVRERRGMWTHRAAPLGTVWQRFACSPLSLIACILVGPFAAIALLCAGVAWVALGALVTLSIGLLVPLFSLRKSVVTTAHICQNKVCPDCSYLLGNLPSAIPQEYGSDFWLGPQHCPECGSWWPMVPPPLVR